MDEGWPGEKADNALISDLRDPAICLQVLSWLNPKEGKA
jgi:hypothetical protein